MNSLSERSSPRACDRSASSSTESGIQSEAYEVRHHDVAGRGTARARSPSWWPGRISTCQPMPSPHDGQYTSRVERPALKPAGAPHPDGKMQLPLLYRLTRRPPPSSTSCTSIPGYAEAYYFVSTSGKAASMNCGVAPIRNTPAPRRPKLAHAPVGPRRRPRAAWSAPGVRRHPL